MTRRSTFSVRSEPSGSISRSCRTRSSFDWSVGLIVPISSRKIVPPSASANFPFFVVVAPVNAPRMWPNSSDSSSVSGIADRPGDELLARAGFAHDEDGALGLGDELRSADDFLHGAAAPDDPVVVEALVALVDQVAVLGPQPLMV